MYDDLPFKELRTAIQESAVTFIVNKWGMVDILLKFIFDKSLRTRFGGLIY